MIADCGTPYLRAIVSMFSPGPMVTGLPPSHVHPADGAGGTFWLTDPVSSEEWLGR
jgi:hypothetical protein